jgi:hypothetical protein
MTTQPNLRSIWGESVTLLVPVFKRAWWWLVFSMALEEAFTYWVHYLSKADERLSIIGVIFAVVLQLLVSAIGIIIINQMIYDVRRGSHTPVIEGLNKNLKYVFIESTRALLPVLLRCLLLIIPGVIEGIRLYFVPYVAQFDEVYRAGNVDALERSRAIVKNRFWAVTGILLLTVVISMVPRLYLESIDMFSQAALYVLVFVVSMLIELYGDVATFMAYVRLEEIHGNKISLS